MTQGSTQGIVATEVRRTFRSTVAVDSMSLTVPPGQVTALVGPNGAGKTTLLLMLATLLVPDRGSITVGGWDPVTHPREVRRLMGWMPDTFGTYDNLTVVEALQFSASAYRLRGPEVETRVRDLLAAVHLDELADRPVHVLSRGQKQRLGLARVMVHDPQVLLLDEPAAGLDPRSRVELRTLLRRWAAEGRAVLVSSHVLSELEEMADRVVFVDAGRTVDERDVRDLGTSELRAWRVRALDDEALERALAIRGLSFQDAGAAGVDVMLTGDDQAAELVADLIGAGIPLVAFAPSTGALEAAYLAMTEDRK